MKEMLSVYSTATTLFFVMDPLGNIPLFLSILSSIEGRRRYWIIIRESLIAFLVLCAFLFFGDNILLGLGITQPALSISGGIILFLIALKMIFPKEENEVRRDRHMYEPFIVPLAIPLIAGPSAIATVMLFGTQSSEDVMKPFLGLIIASTLSTLLLLLAPKMRKILGQKGLFALERLMGMVLTTIAVQMFLGGIKQYFLLG